ncbi:hypothetical protein MN116_000445 [Schistosoma mekongi]|uniref:MAM domain-containing protein n=1 Tax=Schistosoma mekongi TaxID=38744 RepID=A0AAE1ZF45_SCHME|nr:hypothetical protein MN116_000445 [Schistosoma mekongi]
MRLICSILFIFILSAKAIRVIEPLDYSSESHVNLECAFKESMCNWGNDPNNWPVNWRLNTINFKEELSVGDVISVTERYSVCLSSSGKSTNYQFNNDVTARLFSPIVSIMKQPSCIQLIYDIHFHSDSSRDRINLNGGDLNLYGVDDKIPRLSLLRRQMG